MSSRRKLAPIVGREGISGVRGNAVGREAEVPLVEIDASFGRMLGLQDAQKVRIIWALRKKRYPDLYPLEDRASYTR
jgi:peroxin-1